MGFQQSQVDLDLWYRDAGDHYKYIAVYVNDVLVFSRRAREIMTELQSNIRTATVTRLTGRAISGIRLRPLSEKA